MRVEKVARSDLSDLILHKHYACRWPSVSFAFGLFDGEELLGGITYGTPSSAPLRSGLLGPELSSRVLELNRLCLYHNQKNEASYLIANSLKLLPGPRAIVSFADPSHGHVGTVYQACNFIYCGLSAKRTDWKVRGKEHMHGQTIADEFRGVKNRAAAMREKYGDDFYLSPRPRKHRYVYFIGSKKERKEMFAALRYKQEGYPRHA